MKIPLLSSAFIILLVLCCCHSEDRELSDKFDSIETILDIYPDSSLNMLRRIDTLKISGRKNMARYALMKAMVYYKNSIYIYSHDEIKPAVDYYLKKGTNDQKLRTYFFEGDIYYTRGELEKAMDCFVRGRKIAEEGCTDSLNLGRLLANMALITDKQCDVEKSLLLVTEAASIYKAIGIGLNYSYNLARVLASYIYLDEKEKADSVFSIYERERVDIPCMDSVMAPYVLCYALTYGDKADIINGMELLERYGYRSEYSLLDLSTAYSELGDYGRALEILDSIDYVPIKSEDEDLKMKYFLTRCALLDSVGRHKEALMSRYDFDSLFTLSQRELRKQDFYFPEKRYEDEKQYSDAIAGKNMKILQISIILAITVIILILAFYSIRFLNKRRHIADMALEKERENIQRERSYRLEEHRKLIHEMEERVQEKNRRIEIEKEMRDLNNSLNILRQEYIELKKLKDSKGSNQNLDPVIKKRLQIFNGIIASEITQNQQHKMEFENFRDGIWKDKEVFMTSLIEIWTLYNPKFIQRLEESGLTPIEKNFACLFALGLSGKEIGVFLNKSRHYHISSSIRKKLGLKPSDTNINNYLCKLLNDEEDKCTANQ